jgi:CheY-like chemotaxis protein/anti-sigma regulatory factor (Ser/Thr protein kinase)
MPKILIVDDDEVDREIAARCLEGLDPLTVLTAADGNEALASIAASKPDLVVTDLRMPGMDGLELVQKLRQEHPLLPVVLVTSHGSEHIAIEALKSGAASYVSKAELKSSLAETVERILEVVGARRMRAEVVFCLEQREMIFNLDNDLKLISPVAAFVQESLEALEFGDDSIRSQISMALMEALSNAMIHGNLEVSSDLRDSGTEPYFAMIERRKREEPYASRRLRLIVNEAPGRVEYAVMDEGPGFDYGALPDVNDMDSVVRTRGRGMMLIRTFMDDVRHNEQGNLIVMAKSLQVG